MQIYITASIIFGVTVKSVSSRSSRHLRETRRNNDIICQGESLKAGEALRPGEYIGPDYSCPDGGYRVGLDHLGRLASWSYDNTIEWSPGVSGDYLLLQASDANLVLYQENGGGNVPVWASDCLGDGDGAEFTRTEVVNKEGETVWKIHHNGQESQCYPGLEEPAPEITCKGSILGSNVKLKPNEYICTNTGQHHRFGMNAQGKMALWHGNSVIWSPPWKTNVGDFLHMKTKGKLQLHRNEEGQDRSVWDSGCESSGAVLSIDNGGVKILKENGDVLWMVDEFGKESTCNPDITPPDDDCSQVSPEGSICEVRMIDHLNMNYVKLRVEDLGNKEFRVTDSVDGDCGRDPWHVPVLVLDDGTLEIDAGVPDVTCVKLIEDYEMEDNSQLHFVFNENFPCTAFGKDLIYFLIHEWYYFG